MRFTPKNSEDFKYNFEYIDIPKSKAEKLVIKPINHDAFYNIRGFFNGIRDAEGIENLAVESNYEKNEIYFKADNYNRLFELMSLNNLITPEFCNLLQNHRSPSKADFFQAEAKEIVGMETQTMGVKPIK